MLPPPAIKDCAAILVAVVAELSILRQGIDVVPEHVEQLVVAYLGRVVHDLHRLGMTSAAVRDLLVGRIGRMTAGITRGLADHALDLVEIGLHTPEAAARESPNRPPLPLVTMTPAWPA